MNYPSEKDFKLAAILLDHSLELKPKEKLLISISDSADNPLVKAVYIEALKRGAYPLIDGGITNFFVGRASYNGLAYQLLSKGNEWQRGYAPKEVLSSLVDWADAYVRITQIGNKKELSQLDPGLAAAQKKVTSPLFRKMIDSDRWVLTYYPNEAMAQEAGVSLDWLLDFFYDACIVDYVKMEKQLHSLEKVLDAGSLVEIKGKDTELTVGIKGRLAKSAYGERNIPDGEVFLAPERLKVNGHVKFDLPSIYQGQEVSGVYVEFKDGKVVKAKADFGEAALHKILNSDEGSKYLGEFAIGANFNIKQGLKETLFDEKIGGTIHMALGRSYAEKRGGAPKGGNTSVIHWDLVKDMRVKGSSVKVDGKVILKDGKILV